MTEQKEKALLNLKKARSLIDTMAKMIEKDAYCIDIMQQNLAVIGLLKSAHLSLMEGHLSHCFLNATGTKDVKRRQEMIAELVKVAKMAGK